MVVPSLRDLCLKIVHVGAFLSKFPNAHSRDFRKCVHSIFMRDLKLALYALGNWYDKNFHQVLASAKTMVLFKASLKCSKKYRYDQIKVQA